MSLPSSSAIFSGHYDPAFLTKTNNGLVVTTPQAAGNKRQKDLRAVVLPQNQPAAALFSGSNTSQTVYFDVPHNLCDDLDQILLQFSVVNTSATLALALTDGWSMINNLTILDNNVPIQVLYGQGLRKNGILMNYQEPFAVISQGVGIDTTSYAANTSIASGGSNSFTFYIPLWTVLSTSRFPLWRREHQLRLALNLRTGTDVVLSTSAATAASASLSGMQLILDGTVYESSVRQALDRILDDAPPVVYRYLDCSFQSIALGSTTTNVAIQGNANAPGRCAYFFADLQSSSATNESIYTPSAINSLQYLSNSQVVSDALGDNANTYALMKMASYTHFPNPMLLTKLNAAYIAFCENPGAALVSGEVSGWFKSTGLSEAVRILPGVTAGNQVLNCYFYNYSAAVYDYGSGKQAVVYRSPVD